MGGMSNENGLFVRSLAAWSLCEFSNRFMCVFCLFCFFRFAKTNFQTTFCGCPAAGVVPAFFPHRQIPLFRRVSCRVCILFHFISITNPEYGILLLLRGRLNHCRFQRIERTFVNRVTRAGLANRRDRFRAQFNVIHDHDSEN